MERPILPSELHSLLKALGVTDCNLSWTFEDSMETFSLHMHWKKGEKVMSDTRLFTNQPDVIPTSFDSGAPINGMDTETDSSQTQHHPLNEEDINKSKKLRKQVRFYQKDFNKFLSEQKKPEEMHKPLQTSNADAKKKKTEVKSLNCFSKSEDQRNKSMEVSRWTEKTEIQDGLQVSQTDKNLHNLNLRCEKYAPDIKSTSGTLSSGDLSRRTNRIPIPENSVSTDYDFDEGPEFYDDTDSNKELHVGKWSIQRKIVQTGDRLVACAYTKDFRDVAIVRKKYMDAYAQISVKSLHPTGAWIQWHHEWKTGLAIQYGRKAEHARDTLIEQLLDL